MKKNKINYIEILNADKNKLIEISKKYLLSLNADEMLKIQEYFSKEQRNPTDMEIETIAQTWSEHCKHKTLTGKIKYKKKNKNGSWDIRIFENPLKETIFSVTKKLNKKWCISVFKDNAGVIEFDKENAVAFKVETHNHPSALEPYGGAGTGIGGVIRDILGVGLGAKPIMNTDVFCFGPLNYPDKKVPEGVLYPRRIANGVISGVRDYGNRMGIPTANGGVMFDEGYIYNPLVYCGTVGIMPKNKAFKKINPGDLILVVGGKTGRDGIHGATFSSLSLDKDTEVAAVQIGNPIVEKKVVDTVLIARDKNLYNAITDCGAGGFSSAIGELATFSNGAKVHLETAPLKYSGLLPWEIWVSEAQERMVLAVPPENIKEIIEIFTGEDVEAVVLGEFNDTGRLEVYYEDKIYCNLDMDFLHEGLPETEKTAIYIEKTKQENFKLSNIKSKNKNNFIEKNLKSKLSDLNTCSKELIIRQYDHEVQAQTVIKPLTGIKYDGPSDATVIKPIPNSFKGIVISNGINLYGKYDTYCMAASAIDEALRNIVAVGGDINKTALLDNFCWGALDSPEHFGELIRSMEACYDIASIYETPFISGKDSLNNKYVLTNGKIKSITSTLLISAISVIDDIRKCITMDLKKEENPVYIIGITKNEFVPDVSSEKAKKNMISLAKAIQKGFVAAAHDCSEGGIGVSASEMCFSGGLGMEVSLNKIPFENLNDKSAFKNKNTLNEIILFSESNSRFIVEVKKDFEKDFEKILQGCDFSKIGKVKKDPKFTVKSNSDERILDINISELKETWQTPLRNL